MAEPAEQRRRSGYCKPVIGIAGGVGSGKSVVAKALGELGCGVIDSDRGAHEALQLPEVQAELRRWWGPEVIQADGQVDRKKVAGKVFGHSDAVQRLNALVHPKVREIRDRLMVEYANRPEIVAVVWDTPLLFEVGLDRECDAVLFVKAPYERRLERVRGTRGWDEAELKKREKLQFPLDKKEKLADYSVDNSGEVTATLRHLREILSQILSRKAAPA